MDDPVQLLLILTALVDGTLLYAFVMGRRRHERRVAERLQEASHQYGLVRVMLAERRAA